MARVLTLAATAAVSGLIVPAAAPAQDAPASTTTLEQDSAALFAGVCLGAWANVEKTEEILLSLEGNRVSTLDPATAKPVIGSLPDSVWKIDNPWEAVLLVYYVDGICNVTYLVPKHTEFFPVFDLLAQVFVEAGGDQFVAAEPERVNEAADAYSVSYTINFEDQEAEIAAMRIRTDDGYERSYAAFAIVSDEAE